jgi:hypothetical protein
VSPRSRAASAKCHARRATIRAREPPRFIVLDGVDGCGKSTQAKLLVETLAKTRGAAPLHLREPGSTRVGERLRELVLSREHELDPASSCCSSWPRGVRCCASSWRQH